MKRVVLLFLFSIFSVGLFAQSSKHEEQQDRISDNFILEVMSESKTGVCLLYTLTDNSEGVKGTSGPVKYEEDLLQSVLKENLNNARVIGTDTAYFNSGEEEKMYRFIHLKRTRENVLSLKYEGDKKMVVVYNTDHN